MLNQKLQQRLLQKLSPQQIQLMKLLQLPAIALEQRIKQEMEENPALEDADDIDEIEEAFSSDDEESNIEEDERDEDQIEEPEPPDEISLEDYLPDDDIPDYKLRSNDHDPNEEERREIPFASNITFQEHLLSQLGMRELSETQYAIGEFIIGNLDDSGYLQRDVVSMVDDLAFSQNIITTEKEIQEMLLVIQEFEPYGIGARNLQECLIIQLDRKEKVNGNTELAKTILRRYFNEFTKKHYDRICKKAGITEERLKEAIGEILKLNPKPGNSLVDSTKINQYVTPDFIISNTNGILELTLHSRNLPELRLNRNYVEMVEAQAKDKKNQSSQKRDLMVFVKQKLDSAKWFIDMIRQRHDTLYRTMKAIMDYQKDYFIEGDETLIKPMILKDIAELVNLDISTISRVANSKYVQTPFGTFLLKSFFSESLSTDSGEEVSTREVKKILMNAVEAEDKKKPVTDEQLMTILKEKGYNIARRTVAKYREQLSIPVARLRREL